MADSQIRGFAEWMTRLIALVTLMLVAGGSVPRGTDNQPAPVARARWIAAGLRHPRRHAQSICVGSARRGVRRSSRGVSNGHAREFVVHFNRLLPERHGILGNSVFFPRVEPGRFLDTGQRGDLEKIQADQDGVLLTAPTLGEILQQHGRKLLAVGAGTTGSVFLLNHKVSGGAIIHTEYALPAELQTRITAELGPPPAEGRPNDARNRRAAQAFLQIGLPTLQPAVSIMWLSDPDTTAHALGMGHPTTVEALRRLDREVKAILDGLAAAGLASGYNVWVTSDHGFATYIGAPNVGAIVKSLGGTRPDGTPRIVHGETAIYVRDGGSVHHQLPWA